MGGVADTFGRAGAVDAAAVSVPLSIQATRHRSAAVDARVVCSDPDILLVNADLAQAMLQRYPSLAEHACSSHGLRRFGQVIQGTELPHLVEHLAIDHLVAAHKSDAGNVADAAGTADASSAAHKNQAFAGHTSWLDRQKGAMRVTVGLATERRGQRQQASQQDLQEIEEALSWAVSQVNEAFADTLRATQSPKNR